MNKKLPILFALMLFLAVPVRALALAPHYTLTPTSGGPYAVGTTFSVILGVDTAGEKMVLGDIEGRFDAPYLELMTIEKVGTTERAFPYDDNVTLRPDNVKGEYAITLSDPNNASLLEDGTIANGKLFKLIFKAKAVNVGTTVTFACQSPSTLDSNILVGSDALDKISCTENSKGTYVISAGAGGTTGLTSTPATTRTATTTATLPRTGGTTQTVVISMLGVFGIIGAFFLKFL